MRDEYVSKAAWAEELLTPLKRLRAHIALTLRLASFLPLMRNRISLLARIRIHMQP